MCHFYYITCGHKWKPWIIQPPASVQFSCSVKSDSWRPHGLQHTRLPSPLSTPGVKSNSCPLSPWCHPIISYPASPPPPAFNLSQHQGLFQWVSSLQQVAKLLEFQLQHQSFQWIFSIDFLQDWLVWPPCCPRDSQQHRSWEASILRHLAFFMVQLSHPDKTTGKNHRFDYMELCWQNYVSAF